MSGRSDAIPLQSQSRIRIEDNEEATKEFAGTATKEIAGTTTKEVARTVTKEVAGTATKEVAGTATKEVGLTATKAIMFCCLWLARRFPSPANRKGKCK